MSGPKCYVFEPYVPNGGTYMAYQLARLVQQDFGFEGVAVGATDAAHGIFQYDEIFPLITTDELISVCKDRDLLIMNPSFSPHWLGLRCKGRKVMYVQGFSTFHLMDCHFDLYVTVSTFVQNFIRSTYGIRTRVIPPFIQPSRFPEPRPWHERKADSILVSKKGDQNLQTLLLDRLRLALSTRRCDVRLDDMLRQGRPQSQLLEQVGEYRHFLTLSPAEGFGLMPLEAMAMGTTVLGFDGYGGRDYMHPGINCDVASFADIEGVADGIARAIADPDYAETLTVAGRQTAHHECYTYERFRSSWRAEFEDLLSRESS